MVYDKATEPNTFKVYEAITWWIININNDKNKQYNNLQYQ